MKYNPDIHHRRSIRLKGYDYSQAGLYFITICTQNKLCLFGEVEDGNMQSNVAGKMIKQQWQGLIHRFNTIRLHEFIVMPNHFHGIIELVGVPLVGTQNDGNPHFVKQQQQQSPQQPPQSQMGQLSIMGQPQGIAPTVMVGDVVGAFKSLSTNEYIKNVKRNNWQPFNKKLWQRNYYEHIIRDENSYYRISEYIQTNPLKWQKDNLYIPF